jgi:hypothetical protein
MILSISMAGPMKQSVGPFTTPIRFYAGFLITYVLSVAHYLDHAVVRAFEKLRPNLQLDDASFQLSRFQLATLPALPALIVSVSTLMVSQLSLLFYPAFIGIDLNFRDPSQLSFIVQGFVVWWLLGFGAYHTLHQLGQVRRVYAKHLHVNLYKIEDLYSLSNITALSSIGIIIPISIAIIVMPEYIVQPLGFTIVVLAVGLAILTFAWPLWNVHLLMVEEKERLQIACSTRYEALLGDWHAKLDKRELNDSGDLKNAIQVLLGEKDEIIKIPTWPWPAGIFRGWLASLFVPLIIWTLQWLIENIIFTS